MYIYIILYTNTHSDEVITIIIIVDSTVRPFLYNFLPTEKSYILLESFPLTTFSGTVQFGK